MITIHKDGIYTKEFNENLNIEDFTRIGYDIEYYYKDEIQLEDGLTLGQILNVLEPYISKLEEHFASDTKKWPLQPFFDAIKRDVKEDMMLKEIHLAWCYQYFENPDRKTGTIDKTLDEYIDLYAVGESGEKYSIEFIELNNIKNVPVKIITDVKLYDGYANKLPIIEFTKNMTLRDFIGSLLFELTFYGTPENAQKQLEMLNEISEKIKTGDKSELVPFETLQLQWLEDELQTALEEEDYEWAQRVKNDIELLKEKMENKK